MMALTPTLSQGERGQTRGERGLTRRAFLRDLARLGCAVAGFGLLPGCTSAPTPATSAPTRIYRIGLLSASEGAQAIDLLWERLGGLGYVDGQNLVREERFAEDDVAGSENRFHDFAAELVRMPVDVIVAESEGAIRAAMAATQSVPIVMLGSSRDPVTAGFVASLAHPGGNVTGVVTALPELDLKRLQLLVEAAPRSSRVAVLGGAGEPDIELAAAARSVGVDLFSLRVASRDDYEAAFERAVASGADALLVRAGGGTGPNTGLIASLAARHRLPGIAPSRAYVARGGLMAYDARASNMGLRAADYVDRILRGARPADLPVDLPTRYDLIVNLGTARAIGLTFPPAFLAQVDEVIE